MTKPELYAQAELVKRLHELKVADNEDEDSDNDADESRELSVSKEKTTNFFALYIGCFYLF